MKTTLTLLLLGCSVAWGQSAAPGSLAITGYTEPFIAFDHGKGLSGMIGEFPADAKRVSPSPMPGMDIVYWDHSTNALMCSTNGGDFHQCTEHEVKRDLDPDKPRPVSEGKSDHPSCFMRDAKGNPTTEPCHATISDGDPTWQGAGQPIPQLWGDEPIHGSPGHPEYLPQGCDPDGMHGCELTKMCPPDEEPYVAIEKGKPLEYGCTKKAPKSEAVDVPAVRVHKSPHSLHLEEVPDWKCEDPERGLWHDEAVDAKYWCRKPQP
jgi:hypothetical protein